MNQKIVIVGAGISGVMTWKGLQHKGFRASVIESEAKVGGRASYFLDRVLQAETVSTLETYFSGLFYFSRQNRESWVPAKVGWEALQLGRLEPFEAFYTETPFFECRLDRLAFESFSQSVGENLHLGCQVAAIHPEHKEYQLINGNREKYDFLFWCASVENLRRALPSQFQGPLLERRTKREVVSRRGILIENVLSGPFTDLTGTLVLSPTFKGHPLNLLGFQKPDESLGGACKGYWLCFLTAPQYEDQEETAKAIKTLKKEIHKHFPGYAKLITGEKITQMETLSGENRLIRDSYTPYPDLYIVGPEWVGSKTEENLSNIDLVVHNFNQVCHAFFSRIEQI